MEKIVAIIIYILFLLNIPNYAHSQELKRRAMLGIRMQNVNDSIANAKSYKGSGGVYIDLVVPGSTTDNVGMKSGAILTKINDRDIKTMRDIGPSVPNLREGDDIQLSYFQDGKMITKKTTAIGRPREVVEGANVVYGQVKYGDQRLRSILISPKNKPKAPVVYFIQGYTCSSTEFASVPNITTMRLIKDWVNAGYAVYRIEKAGVGDSEGGKHCMEMNFNEEVEIFRQGYLALQKNESILPEEIFLFGHSMGGVVAPILAKEFTPKGVMTYGTVLNSWFEYMQELTRVQGEMFHTPYAEIEDDIRRVTPFWYEYYVLGKSNTELLKNKVFYTMLQSEGTLENFKNGVFMDRHYSFWQTLQKTRLTNIWLEVKSNVLAIYGEFDIQALNANHVKSISNIVNVNNPGKGSWKVIENADHGFVTFNSMEENVETLNSGRYFQKLQNNYNPEVAAYTIKWMRGLKN